MQIVDILQQQKVFFKTGVTLSLEYRIEKLKLLKETIQKYESEICDALKEDLGKGSFESYMTEVGMTLSELTYMIKKLPKLIRIRSVKTPLAQFHSKSYQLACPYGNVLIMSPWNYPFLLTMGPLVDCLAAGNTAIVKPSAYSKNTTNVIEKIILECFDSKYVAVVKGGREQNQLLLEQKYDYIFFTGSGSVGKLVLQKAANNLTPVTLELGGKSPCIVDETANISLAAKRIVFGKYLNCGQTCVAPDYILCHKNVKDDFIAEVVKQIGLQYGENAMESSTYGKIINRKHFDRINGLIDQNKVVVGGKSNPDTLQIEPTVMKNVTYDDLVMQEEIFGPIMPIIEYESINNVIDKLQDMDKPLALYLFSKNEENIKKITTKCLYGGGCINDTIIHLATNNMGFGGVGESGMGSYHGKVGFDTFSHLKSIVDKKNWIDLPMRYKPYKKFNEKLLRKFLK